MFILAKYLMQYKCQYIACQIIFTYHSMIGSNFRVREFYEDLQKTPRYKINQKKKTAKNFENYGIVCKALALSNFSCL